MTLCHWRLTLVTERTQLEASTSYTVLWKVTQPRDELTYGASRIVLQPRNAVRPSARSHKPASVDARAIHATLPESGS